MSTPRLDPSSLLEPIQTLDELIERASTAVEKLESADELELLLDGLSRFADRRPIDFLTRTAPLLKRVTDLLSKEGWWSEASVRFHRLVQAWLKREPFGALPGRPDWLPPMEFVSRRMQRLSLRLVSGFPGPLLACPTHKAGWLDPRQLVQRLLYWQNIARETAKPPGEFTEQSTPDIFDLIQALLRLAPDHRAEALEQSRDLQGEAADPFRFALGADEPLGRHPSIWIAAARARDPLVAFPQLEQRWSNLGPDAAFPTTRTWIAGHDPAYNRVRLQIEITPAITATNALIDRPLSLLARPDTYDFYMSSIPNIRCCQAIWPANPDPCFADGAIQTIIRLHNQASTFSPLAPYVEPLFDPDTPFSEMAQLALATGLVAKDPGARQMAVDALIEVISDGRCQGPELGAVIGKLAQGKGMNYFNRLPASLTDPSRVSPLHLHAVTLLSQSAIANLSTPPPKDVHHILAHLREWLTQTIQPLHNACRPILESITGSGKTASLAAALLKFVPSTDSSNAQAARAQALRARIDRARRWSNRAELILNQSWQ